MISELGANLIPIFAIGCGASVASLWIVAATVVEVWKQRSESRLKQNMLDRGYSASEIVAVISSTSTSKPDFEVVNPPKPPVKNGVAHASR